MEKDKVYNYLLNKFKDKNPLKYSGFEYTSYILQQDYDLPLKITNIYKEVGKHYNTTYCAMERALRNFKNKMGYESITVKEYLIQLILEIRKRSEKDGYRCTKN